jgi:hypothetical protein
VVPAREDLEIARGTRAALHRPGRDAGTALSVSLREDDQR